MGGGGKARYVLLASYVGNSRPLEEVPQPCWMRLSCATRRLRHEQTDNLDVGNVMRLVSALR